MTLVYIFFTIGLYFVLGWPVVACLGDRRSSAERVILAPIAGLSFGILFTNFLAALQLTGKTIGLITLSLALLEIAAFLLFYFRISDRILARFRFIRTSLSVRLEGARPPVTAKTGSDVPGWREVMLVFATSLGTLVLVGWPLIRQGFLDYWGYANPDQAFYMRIFDWLYQHPFGLPPEYLAPTTNTSVIVGFSYYSSILSSISGLPSKYFFDIISVSFLFTIPIAVFFLSRYGLGLVAQTSLACCFAAGASSLLAYTFYLDSAGALSVSIYLPTAIALSLQYVDRPTWRGAGLLGIILAASYYGYYPGFAVTAVSVAVIFVYNLALGRVTWRRVGILVLIGFLLVAAPFLHQSANVLKSLVGEMFSRRLRADSQREVLMAFGLYLTEQIVPFLWGLKIPTSRIPGFGFLSAGRMFWAVFGLGSLFTLTLIGTIWTRMGRVRRELGIVLGVLCLVLVAYGATQNGYGVFKLVTYICSVLIVGLAAAVSGLVAWLRGRGLRRLAWIPVAIYLCYILPNVAWDIAFAHNVFDPADGLSIHDSPFVDYRSVQGLEDVRARWGGVGVDLAVPDPVVQKWNVPFWGSTGRLFPWIDLVGVDDSDSWRAGAFLKEAMDRGTAKYLLRSKDIIDDETASCGSVWQNREFRLVDAASCHDMVALGSGWYRMEEIRDSPILWQRRFRWLKRRGEVLIFHPSGSAKQLVFTVAAGYGSRSSDRTVEVFLDGRLLEEFHISGYARLRTRPFVPTGPVSRLEFQIVERSSRMPRAYALWNRWVPGDPRILNAAFSRVALYDAGWNSLPVVDALDFSDPEAFGKVLSNGIYPDAWVADQANITLVTPARAERLVIDGLLPGVRSLQFPYRIGVYWDGKMLGTKDLTKPGDFTIAYAIPPDARNSAPAVHTIDIRPCWNFVPAALGINSDNRALSVHLRRMVFQTASTTSPAPEQSTRSR